MSENILHSSIAFNHLLLLLFVELSTPENWQRHILHISFVGRYSFSFSVFIAFSNIHFLVSCNMVSEFIASTIHICQLLFLYSLISFYTYISISICDWFISSGNLVSFQGFLIFSPKTPSIIVIRCCLFGSLNRFELLLLRLM